MKKSDYEAERREHWGRHYGEGGFRDLQVKNDSLAAEAAGVVWDPEEPRLADELSCGIDGGMFLARVRDAQQTGVWFRLDRESGAPFDARATSLEVVRRYNAWPELEELLQQSELCDWPGRHRLKAILRKGAS